MTRLGAALLGSGWRVGVVLLLPAVCAAACGGGGTNRVTAGSAPASPTAANSRLAVDERLALLDASPPPLAYAEVLTVLTQKCRESRTELAEAIIAARRALAQERGIPITVLDYLRGVDRAVPAGSRDVDCTAIAAELGRALGH